MMSSQWEKLLKNPYERAKTMELAILYVQIGVY